MNYTNYFYRAKGEGRHSIEKVFDLISHELGNVNKVYLPHQNVFHNCNNFQYFICTQK